MATLRSFTRPTATWNPSTEQRDTIRYVDVSAVSRETLSIEPVGITLAKDAPSRARKIVRAGDTIFATIRPTLKRVAKVPLDLDGEIVSTAFCVLRPNMERLDPDYLFFLASSDCFVSSIAEHETGASYPAVRDRDVFDQEVELPELAEQRDIATALDALRRSVLNEITLLGTAQELKQSAMRELFTKGLRGDTQKDTDIGLVPKSWAEVSIASLGEIVTGTTPPTKERAYYDGGNIPFISPGDIGHGMPISSTQKYITDSGLEVSRSLPAGTTCVVCIGSTIGKVGRTTAAVSASNQQINAIIPSMDYDQNYLSHLLTYRSDIVRNAASPSPVPILSKGAFEKLILFTSTNLDEQTQIADILSAIDRKIDLHRQKRAVLEELFQSLLHKLMTGEISVSELDLSALTKGEAA